MNCKPGDLAIVIKADVPEAIGLICEVLRASPTRSSQWVVKFQRPIKGANYGLVTEILDAPDDYLRPISGLPDTEDTTTNTPIKELA